MVSADALIGKEGFQQANDSLLVLALKNDDHKAQVLYYVEQLRHVTRLENATDNAVLQAQEELKAKAAEYGYWQYYYQSYQFVKNYYFNRGFLLKSMECIQEMHREALNADNDYGKWLSDKSLAEIYQNYGAGKSARNP